jgi:hypothetical protein
LVGWRAKKIKRWEHMGRKNDKFSSEQKK